MAKKTQSAKHIHKYHKLDDIWHCALPDCTHFMPKNVAKNIVGKRSICWTCGNVILLSEKELEMDEPECVYCRLNTTPEIMGELIEAKTPEDERRIERLRLAGLI